MLWIRINQSFGFFSIFRFLPFSILIALKCDLSEKIIDVSEIIKRSRKGFLTVYCFRSMESWVWIFHTIHRFDRFRLLECGLAILVRIRIMLLVCKIWHFWRYFTFIKIIKIGELVALGLMDLTAVVLESTCSFTGSCLLLSWAFGKLLNWFQIFVVYSSQIIVLKLDVFQLWMKYVHFTSILKNDFIIEL